MKNTRVLAMLGTIVSIIVFIYGCLSYLKLKQEYNEVDKTYGSIIDICIDEQSDNPQVEQLESFKVNWEELKSINEDAIAWIKIDDTNINYPIVQGESNESYLYKDINGKYSKGGCIFVDSEIEQPFRTLNTIIYGHNLNDGAIFNNLKNYSNNEYAKKHNEVKIYLPEYSEPIIYQIFAFCKINEKNTDFYKTEVTNLEEYYKEIDTYNLLNVEENLDCSRPLIMLSTCNNDNKTERYVVFAYLK